MGYPYGGPIVVPCFTQLQPPVQLRYEKLDQAFKVSSDPSDQYAHISGGFALVAHTYGYATCVTRQKCSVDLVLL